MNEWKPKQLGNTLWFFANLQIQVDDGRVIPAVTFTKGEGKPQYAFAPLIELDKTGQDVTKATFMLLTAEDQQFEQNIPADIFPKELRDYVSERIQAQIARGGLRFTEGLIEAIENGDKVLQDTAYVPPAELDAAIGNILIGTEDQTADAKSAGKTEELIASGKPADYHTQIDRLLDEGGPEAAAAYAAQFEKPKGHAAQQQARREQGHGTEPTR